MVPLPPILALPRRALGVGATVGVLAGALLLAGSAQAAKKPHRVTKPAAAAQPQRQSSAPAEKTSPAAQADQSANVLKTEEGKEGVKTYEFRAVEVESRLRSPQLIYFLRRVRAEFAATDLGHRSFLRELSETDRNPAFR